MKLRVLPVDFPAQLPARDGGCRDVATDADPRDAGAMRCGRLRGQSAESARPGAPPVLQSGRSPAPSVAERDGALAAASEAPQQSLSALPVWEHPYDPPEDVVRQHEEELMSHFQRVFARDGTLREMVGGPMQIELTDDAVPSAITAARTIPYCWRDSIKRQLDELLERGIIEPVDHPTDWTHPMVPVAKKDGGVRLCVDLTRLNKFVKRPTYPTRPVQDAVAGMEGKAHWMTSLDATMGYHQIQIAEHCRDLTCFITPYGRMRYIRCPMGLVSAMDVYNRRGDEALGDIAQTVKIVDDVLAYDASYRAHLAHVITVLQRCDDRGITLNPKKFQFARHALDFCGYHVTESGYTVDDNKLKAVAEFPRPENVTDLRSFMGLTNQLSGFSADLASVAQPLRDLLKQKTVWNWTAQQEEAFQMVKRALVAPPVLAFFNPQAPTALHTDAARTRGLGFVLMQRHGDKWAMIQCGSRFLTDTESRYSVIELECLAVLWACRKCHMYLAGLPNFDLVMDHRPLIPILNSKRLTEIDNPRLQRMREKLTQYSFTASWHKGVEHCAPDALSRAPISDPMPDEEVAEDALHAAVVAALTATSEDGARIAPLQDRTLDAVRAAAARDPEYTALRDTVLDGFPEHRFEAPLSVRPYWGIRDMLAVDDNLVVYGPRLIIPGSLRREVLAGLHDAHQGMEKTKRRARQSVFWPGIDRDIANTVAACSSCRQLVPSHCNEPLWQEEEEVLTRVFESVSADYFHVAGRTYLIYVR